VWETGTWKRLTRIEQTDPMYGAAFSPDGQFVALAVAGIEDKTVRIHRRDDGQLVRTIDLGTVVPLDVVWHAQGNRLYVPCTDKVVRIYDAGSGSYVAGLAGHAAWVHRVALTADASKLATGSADGTVKLWASDGWRLLATLVQLMPRSDEWLILTPAGHLATSSPAAVQWRAAGLKTPPDKLTPLVQNPELVKQAMAGGKVAPPAVP
jgi:WD40 repeat protein